MKFSYQKIKQENDLTLADWRQYLEPTEQAIFESELGDFEWYAVLNDKQKVVVIFQIINVLDKYAKNLKISFHPNFKQDEYDIINIIIFIYKSMLEICGEKGIKKLKLYIDNSLIHDIFMLIATHQENNKYIMGVKNYSKWIEIQMK